MTRRQIGLTLLVTFMTLTACQPASSVSRHGNPVDYRTVPGNTSRNLQLARQHHDRAIEFIDSGKHDQAEEQLKLALKVDVEYGPAHNNLGFLYFQQGKLYLAAWEFQHAAKTMPSHAEPRNNLGLVYERVGRLAEAIEQYQQAHELAPQRVEITGNLVRARIRIGDDAEDLVPMLRDVAMKDERPEWAQWARHQLGRRGEPVLE